MMTIGEEFSYDPLNDPLLHAGYRPFCMDGSCICKEDQEAISELAEDVQNGLLTKAEASLYYRGRTI